MDNGLGGADKVPAYPGWLPEGARRYLLHTDGGLSIRELARGAGCHASTVLRQVRRIEGRRDDPLVDAGLRALTGCGRRPADSPGCPVHREGAKMTAATGAAGRVAPDDAAAAEADLSREARRILRRMSEGGAVLAVAPDLDRAVVLRDLPGGGTARTAVVARTVAQAFALKDWIARRGGAGRVITYEITAAGRAALKRLLAEDQAARTGLAEAAHPFGAQHGDWEEVQVDGPEGPRRLRLNVAESPLGLLGRRREKDGTLFLTPDLVRAGERLREDFECAQIGPRVAQNWDRFLTAGADRGGFPGDGKGAGPAAARARVAAALSDLGPGLGDMVLRVCCFLEGLEATERRMGWSARSGKIVLRIGLMRLKRHYDAVQGRYGATAG
jgi:hypothetical protein